MRKELQNEAICQGQYSCSHKDYPYHSDEIKKENEEERVGSPNNDVMESSKWSDFFLQLRGEARDREREREGEGVESHPQTIIILLYDYYIFRADGFQITFLFFQQSHTQVHNAATSSYEHSTKVQKELQCNCQNSKLMADNQMYEVEHKMDANCKEQIRITGVLFSLFLPKFNGKPYCFNANIPALMSPRT